MKKIYIIVILVLSLLLTSCVSKEETAHFDSFLEGNSEFINEIKLNNPLCSFKSWVLDDTNYQFIFIWDNQLRRDLRDELVDILMRMDRDRNRVDTYQVIQIENDSSLNLLMNGKVIHSVGFSELTRFIMLALFPPTFNINSRDFYQQLGIMAIRLETLEILGDTEVICLETETELKLMLSDYEKDVVHRVYDIDSFLTE